MERTYIMIKPDGVQRGLIGEIIKRFEQKGYKLIAMKLTSPGRDHMEKHYEDLAGKKFFPGLISYMTSGPVCECIAHVLCVIFSSVHLLISSRSENDVHGIARRRRGGGGGTTR